MIPSLLLLIKLSLDEQIESLRGQGGGVGDRAAVMPLWQIGSPAVGRLFWVVGGSGDQDGRCQGQQNRDSIMKNIFLAGTGCNIEFYKSGVRNEIKHMN